MLEWQLSIICVHCYHDNRQLLWDVARIAGKHLNALTVEGLRITNNFMIRYTSQNKATIRCVPRCGQFFITFNSKIYLQKIVIHNYLWVKSAADTEADLSMPGAHDDVSCERIILSFTITSALYHLTIKTMMTANRENIFISLKTNALQIL